MPLFSDILTPFANGVRLTVRVKPGQSRSRAVKVVDIGDGKRAVEISVAADARDGKANRALVERLACEWGLGKKQISIKSGETGRLKIIEIAGEPQALMQRIGEMLIHTRHPQKRK
ncbi:MAG: DUF167 domain-containing protein [Alphaproteobacteria bacterium]|nr:DUF167 domain-containing protein [Alphaproteobacteria bacterium]